MDNPFDNEVIERFKQTLQNDGPAAAAERMQAYLKEQENIPLNIAVTGETGAGKSTFVNAFRGVDSRDENAAPTGCVETTFEVKSYPHPNNPNVILWDLPGIGTKNFPADEYLKKVEFEKFDFFIIISADRFRENDVKLAKEIQKMKKKFYFIRSKIDNNMRDEERSQRDFNQEETLKQIRENCIQGLQKQGVESPKVFLISNFDLHLYDFALLEETLNKELPALQRDALLLAMPIISLQIINKKKKAFGAKIQFYAALSASIASAPIPGLSLVADIGILVSRVREYQIGFGLDSVSLQKLAASARVPLNDLEVVMTSPLAAQKITKKVLIKTLTLSTIQIFLMTAEEGSRFIPIFGIPAGMALSFTSTYTALNTFLNMLAEDAQNVFKRALGLNTSV